MMATNTANYNLKKPGGNDTVNIEDINSNMDILDAALFPAIDQSIAPASNGPAKINDWLNWLTNRVKAITGKANWYDTPSTTLEAANTHMNTANAHNATVEPTASRQSKSSPTSCS
jgi:hypothetical protein